MKASTKKPAIKASQVKVKVCGLRTLDDAMAAVDAGADALGFNFYPASPRSISLRAAAGIIAKLPPFVTPVAVWVNPSLGQVREALGACRWGALQFSGDEEDELLLSFPSDLCIQTVRLADKRSLTALKSRPRSAAWLVDASVKGSFGGTGKVARWDLAAMAAKMKPVILAGGLTPENVAEAVRVVRPYGVDTASGVEKSPGRKDAALMKAFVRAAKGSGK